VTSSSTISARTPNASACIGLGTSARGSDNAPHATDADVRERGLAQQRRQALEVGAAAHDVAERSGALLRGNTRTRAS
jgi:hypothetical protein